MFEWKPVTSQDYLEVWIFETVKLYQSQLRELVLEYIGRNVILDEINISQGFGSIPFSRLVNSVEHNLRNLAVNSLSK